MDQEENLVKQFLENREKYLKFAKDRCRIINDPLTRAIRTIKNVDPKLFNLTDSIEWHS